MSAFNINLRTANEFGIIIGVEIPEDIQELPSKILRQLRKQELLYAQSLSGKTRLNWIAGRVAARHAIDALGLDCGAIMSGPRGEPVTNNDVALSISHKSNTAIAIAAKKEHGTLGIDIEDRYPKRPNIASRVLTENEMSDIQELDSDRQWISILKRFSAKECIYKALAPKQKRFISFQEAEIFPIVNGNLQIRLFLEKNPIPSHINGQFFWNQDQLITTIRASWK
tara:strand:- start:228 stop:905 length:678 start_codon:yes stop_codon:yes gene_type:complete